MILHFFFGLFIASDVYAAQKIEGVTYATADINAHSGGGATNLTLDLYYSDNGLGENQPALVLVHGGSFTSGDSESLDMVQAATNFANLGWVCASINYRLEGDDPPAPWWIELFGDAQLNAAYAAAVDTKRAVRWLRANAHTYGIDPQKIAGLGHSAGAYCALMAAITDEDDFANDDGTATPDMYAAYSGKINACIEVSGDDGIYSSEFDTNDAPIMIWHGDADATVPHTEAEAIAQSCADQRIPHKFYTLAGVDHGAATWLATYDGTNLLDHAESFLNLFFNAQLEIVSSETGITLQWPSLSNAVYNIVQTANLYGPWTNYISTNVQADADTAEFSISSAANHTSNFYRLNVLSGN